VSVNVLNQIVGEAIVNEEFCRVLLANPGVAVSGFDLRAEERALISGIRAQSVDHLARQLMATLKPEHAACRTTGVASPGSS
jgi:hypothetical protein